MGGAAAVEKEAEDTDTDTLWVAFETCRTEPHTDFKLRMGLTLLHKLRHRGLAPKQHMHWFYSKNKLGGLQRTASIQRHSHQSAQLTGDRKGTTNIFPVSTLQLGQQERELLLPSARATA